MSVSRLHWLKDVRFGVKADIAIAGRHVRFLTQSGHARLLNPIPPVVKPCCNQ